MLRLKTSSGPWWLAWSTLICAFAGQTDAQTLQSIDGIQQQTRLLGFSDQGWKFSNLSQDLPADHIVHWGSWPGVRKRPAAWLSDGSWLSGELSLEQDQLSVAPDWFAEVKSPLSAVRGLVLRPFASLSAWASFRQELLTADPDADHVWLVSGKRLAGVLSPLQDLKPQTSVELTVSGQPVAIDAADIAALLFSPALFGPLPESKLQVGLQDGSLLRTNHLAVASHDMLRIRLASGMELLTLDASEDFLPAVCYLASSSPASTQYLSDLPVAQYKHIGSSKLVWNLGIDQDCLGRPLAVEDGLVAKGLAMHAASQVAYRWDGSPATFQAEVAFLTPPSASDSALGSVECKVLLAKNGQLVEAESQWITRRGPEPHRAVFQVALEDAQLLVLVTDQADVGQLGDHVLWSHARICRPLAPRP